MECVLIGTRERSLKISSRRSESALALSLRETEPTVVYIVESSKMVLASIPTYVLCLLFGMIDILCLKDLSQIGRSSEAECGACALTTYSLRLERVIEIMSRRGDACIIVTLWKVTKNFLPLQV